MNPLEEAIEREVQELKAQIAGLQDRLTRVENMRAYFSTTNGHAPSQPPAIEPSKVESKAVTQTGKVIVKSKNGPPLFQGWSRTNRSIHPEDVEEEEGGSREGAEGKDRLGHRQAHWPAAGIRKKGRRSLKART